MCYRHKLFKHFFSKLFHFRTFLWSREISVFVEGYVTYFYYRLLRKLCFLQCTKIFLSLKLVLDTAKKTVKMKRFIVLTLCDFCFVEFNNFP